MPRPTPLDRHRHICFWKHCSFAFSKHWASPALTHSNCSGKCFLQLKLFRLSSYTFHHIPPIPPTPTLNICFNWQHRSPSLASSVHCSAPRSARCSGSPVFKLWREYCGGLNNLAALNIGRSLPQIAHLQYFFLFLMILGYNDLGI